MRCSEFHDRVNELMDDYQDPSRDRRIQRHAQACKRCGSVFSGYQTLHDFFEPGAVSRSNKPRRYWSETIIACLACAAAALVAISLSQPQPEPAATASALPGSTPQATTPWQQGDRPAARIATPRGNIVQPILGLSLVAKTDWAQLESVEMPFGMHMPHVQTRWLQVVADEMQPVRQSVDNTFSLILRTLST